ncbi:carbohydrate ABC transporter permease [Spirochaeta isovalerica]|uniref:Putative aldouronate transport system permease protein n=1 Tax=Spirochaeta isovalerica TaxID=150 RepID=A0A841R9E4_9SPIO|nr:carbohydrate ABC transporter permease [Spirochaeta isovalerica]MBB6479981.1 putative aldouronate transport system permease protein [Spirochaeta isovalerica]
MSAIFPTRGEKIFRGFNGSLLILISLLFLVPFLTVFMTSFLSEQEYIQRGPFVLFPEKFDFGAYKMLLFQGDAVLTAYKNTIFRTVVGTILQVGATSLLAYGLSKSDLPGRKIVISALIICIVFPVQIIPLFLLNKSLGLIDSIWSLIWPRLINTQYVFIMMAFFRQIPASLEESAKLDGCSVFQTFVRIILPLSLPSLVTIGLFYAVWQWNDWFDAAMFLISQGKLPVQNLMRTILLSSTMSEVITTGQTPPPGEAIKGAVIVISTLPILAAYPFIQKYFVKGMMIGSVKG